MDEREIAMKAEQLTKQIEGGNFGSLSEELNKMSARDRVAIARAMDELNFQHRIDPKNSKNCLPDIQLSIGTLNGKDELLDIKIKVPAAGGKGKAEYKDVFEREQEYDLKNFHKGTKLYAVARRGDDPCASDFYGLKDGTLIIENPYPQPTEKTRYRLPDDVKWEAIVDGMKTTVYKDGTRISMPVK